MKKVKVLFFAFMFLMLAGSVLAMDDPISIGTKSGNEVKIYVWPSETGPILDSRKGIADEDGIFEATFFSLNVPTFRLQIIVLDSDGDKIRDDKIAGMDTNGSIFIDCIPVVCKVVDKIVEEVGNETTAENESVVGNESVVVEDEVVGVEENASGFSVLGRAIFKDKNGSIRWGYSIGGLVVLMFLVVFTIGVLHRGKTKRVDVLDGDEKELQYMEKKVKETEDKIKNIKEKKGRAVKLENAKKKLVEEEAELKELESEGEDKIEKQEDVVEKAEDVVEKAGKD